MQNQNDSKNLNSKLQKKAGQENPFIRPDGYPPVEEPEREPRIGEPDPQESDKPSVIRTQDGTLEKSTREQAP